MSNPETKKLHGPRCIALVGPYGGGKTSLLESIAHLTGAIPRKGTVASGSSLGDASAEALREASLKLTVASKYSAAAN